MRIGKIRKLIKTLQSIDPANYEQRSTIDPDGCRACLAGHTVLMEGYKRAGFNLCRQPWTRKKLRVLDVAKQILGISVDTADRLFNAMCEGWRTEDLTWDCNTKADQVACAILELEELIAKGSYEKEGKAAIERFLNEEVAVAPVLVEVGKKPTSANIVVAASVPRDILREGSRERRARLRDRLHLLQRRAYPSLRSRGASH